MAYHPFRHLGLKCVAIALATLLWLTVAGEHVVERSMRVPLEFRNIPSELEIVGDPPDSVDVRLRGSSAMLSRLEPGEVVAVLDLERRGRVAAVSTCARRSARAVRRRGGAGAARHGRLELEKSADARCRSVPQLDGEPAPGFVVGRAHLGSGHRRGRGPREPRAAAHGGDDRAGRDRGRRQRPRRRHRRGDRRGGPADSAAERHRDRGICRRRSNGSCAACRCAARNLGGGLAAPRSGRLGDA